MLQLASLSWCCSWLVPLDVAADWSLLLYLLDVGIEWSQAGNVAFFIQTCCCSICPAIGLLADLVGVASIRNTLVELPCWEAALGLGLWTETEVTERVLMCCLADNWMVEGELQCGCPHNYTSCDQWDTGPLIWNSNKLLHWIAITAFITQTWCWDILQFT